MFKKRKKKGNDAEGIAFVAFFFVGMAIGAAFGRWDVGPFLGLALGFLAMLFVLKGK